MSSFVSKSCGGYHGLDTLRVKEAVVERVHGVVGLHSALFLQQDGPRVQSVVGPEDGETGFLIAVDQGPGHTHTNIKSLLLGTVP